jgi:hypothetical protein
MSLLAAFASAVITRVTGAPNLPFAASRALSFVLLASDVKNSQMTLNDGEGGDEQQLKSYDEMGRHHYCSVHCSDETSIHFEPLDVLSDCPEDLASRNQTLSPGYVIWSTDGNLPDPYRS